jgi:hypothetical protein
MRLGNPHRGRAGVPDLPVLIYPLLGVYNAETD